MDQWCRCHLLTWSCCWSSEFIWLLVSISSHPVQSNQLTSSRNFLASASQLIGGAFVRRKFTTFLSFFSPIKLIPNTNHVAIGIGSFMEMVLVSIFFAAVFFSRLTVKQS